MARILLILAGIAIEVYAIAHWAYRSGQRTPGGLNRFIWLAVIIIVPIIGPASWLICSFVMNTEGRRRETVPPTQLPPDDDPESLNRIVDRINRRQGRKPRDQNADNPDPVNNSGTENSAASDVNDDGPEANPNGESKNGNYSKNDDQ